MFGSGFYNPYLYQPYYQAANVASNLGSATGTGILGKSGGLAGFKGLLSKFSFSGFLNSASKTLNVVNQAIPIYYQVRPMINNAKTMFRIMGAVKDDSSTTSQNTTKTSSSNTTNSQIKKPVVNRKIENDNYSVDTNNPVFFI